MVNRDMFFQLAIFIPFLDLDKVLLRLAKSRR